MILMHLLLLAATEAGSAQLQEVTYPSGPLTLAAELQLPAGDGPFPGAVILQGSGDSDRSNSWARAIAGAMVEAGVAVLLTDKRGCGASQGDWRTSDFDDLAGDALAGVAYLRRRDEIDPDRVGLAGLSQGGWVAPLAAARSTDVAFVINISGAAVSFLEQSFVEMANTARQAGLDEGGVQEVLDLNREAGRYLASGRWEPYGLARSKALQGPWKEIAAGFPSSPDQPIWTFLRGVADYDPIPYWMLLEQPVLVVYGAEDEKDNVPVAQSVRALEFAFRVAGKASATIEVIPGAGHGLIDRQRRRLMDAFVEVLTAWIRANVTGAVQEPRLMSR